MARQLTEQEWIERVVSLLEDEQEGRGRCSRGDCPAWEDGYFYRNKCNLCVASQIFRDKEIWAKQAGWVKPPESMEITELAEVLYNLRHVMNIKNIEANIQSFLLANHYVKQHEYKPTLQAWGDYL